MRTPSLVRRGIVGGLVSLALSQAGAADLTTSVSSSLWSRYMWRGLRFSNGAVVQSSVTCDYRGASLNLWTNYDLDAGKINEVDPTLSYGWTWKGAEFGVGWTHFGVVDAPDNDEVYASVTKSDWFLSPSLACYWDLDLGKGLYWQAGVSHGVPVGPRATLNLSATAGYVVHNGYMGMNAEGEEFADWFAGEVVAALPITVAANCTVEPRVGFSFPLSRQAREAIRGYGYGTDSCTLHGAIVVTVTF